MRYRKGWIALVIMAILSPLGLLAIGEAWGEWDLETVKELVGFSPRGMKHAMDTSKEAPFPDYEVPGLNESGISTSLGTIVTALLGAGITALALIIICRVVQHVS